ncbi:hypothetical protein CcrC1_gp288 [Caulobacter phage C1]|nr:hypothetical protein CcrC1_gp288 [Caulobacter phage C1]UTU08517.1 hypothetical protein CcrC2_gp289 [Caulobacter phage C2]UTU09033.1 hypothetical protein CcrJ4_gp284 [Caulobacter phage J4]UTU10150.1 hypothetical protein CcrRB23_gp288 [Caulobacter phage RB23]WGN97184.1 hypothetical protein [Bertelyvirus sp.]
MTYTRKQAVIALEHLTPPMPGVELDADGRKIAKPPADLSWGTKALSRRLNVDVATAKDIEDELVADGLLRRTPGFYNTPRFHLTESGAAYLILARRGAQTAEGIVERIPRGPIAADPISMRGTLNEMEFRGLVTTSDGATYALAA